MNSKQKLDIPSEKWEEFKQNIKKFWGIDVNSHDYVKE
jgi:hypothetical protein